jgi:Low molecular weight phosphotyrosine protein phosphatase
MTATINDVPEVLFVCVHNAGRSQMAAALLDHHAKGVVITMGCGDACPNYPGKRYEDWELQDPASRSRWCGASATTSTPASSGCWPSSYQPAPEGLTAATSPQKGEANAPSRRDTQP